MLFFSLFIKFCKLYLKTTFIQNTWEDFKCRWKSIKNIWWTSSLSTPLNRDVTNYKKTRFSQVLNTLWPSCELEVTPTCDWVLVYYWWLCAVLDHYLPPCQLYLYLLCNCRTPIIVVSLRARLSWLIGKRSAHNAVRTVQSRRGILRGHTCHSIYAFPFGTIDGTFELSNLSCELNVGSRDKWNISLTMTAVKKVLAMRQLDSMFGNLNIDGDGRRSPYVSSVIEHDPHCDVHGSSRCSTPYRSSLYLHSRESTPGYYRDSVSPSNGLIIRYLYHKTPFFLFWNTYSECPVY